MLGGTGTVGAATCAALLKNGWKVRATHFTRSGQPCERLDWQTFSLSDETSVAALVEAVRGDCATLLVDALGRFSTAELNDEPDVLQRIAWENASGRVRLLRRIIDVLPPGAVVVRAESWLGTIPALGASVFSVVRAGDRQASALLARAAIDRGVVLGSVVISGLAESVTVQEAQDWIRRTGQPPPSADVAALAILQLAAIMGAVRVPVRVELGLLLPFDV